MPQYDLSVIIPTYNRLNVLKRTLSCINKQTISRDRYQIIVVDDASSDGTGEYLNTLGNIDYHINETNKGRAITRNIGIRKAKSNLILFIDDDIWADSRLLEAHIKKHKYLEAVVVGAIIPSLETKITAVNIYYNRHHEWCLKEMRSNATSLPYNFLKTANLSVPKKIFDKIGIFDERFYHYGCEDTELGARIKSNGYKIVFEDNAVGFHYHNETVEGMINKIIANVISAKLFQDINRVYVDNYNGFFIPEYHKNDCVRNIIYNAIKRVLFLKIVRDINLLTIKLLNNNKTMINVLVTINLPIIRTQYLHNKESV